MPRTKKKGKLFLNFKKLRFYVVSCSCVPAYLIHVSFLKGMQKRTPPKNKKKKKKKWSPNFQGAGLTSKQRSRSWQENANWNLRGFSHNKNAQLEWSFELPAILMMIVFWPVCTQISITKVNLNCAIQMMVWRCFPVTHRSLKSCSEFAVWMHWPLFVIWGGGGGGGGATWPSKPLPR